MCHCNVAAYKARLCAFVSHVLYTMPPQPGAYLEVKYVVMVPSEGEPTIYNHNLEDPRNPDLTSVREWSACRKTMVFVCHAVYMPRR